MYLLYLDESSDPYSWQDNNHFVLGGVAVFEGDIPKLTQELDGIQASLFPHILMPNEFHAHHVYKGIDRWRKEPRETRLKLMDSVYEVVARQRWPGCALFATAVHVSYPTTPGEALVDAFEDMCTRFNTLLVRQFNAGYPSKGLLIVDKSNYERRYRDLVDHFRTHGTRHGFLGNIVDVPYFTDSHHTRMMQLADFCAYAVLLHYEKRESRYFETILDRFDRRSAGSHPDGLKHLIARTQGCKCEACWWR